MTAPRELPLPLTPELVLAVLRGEKTRTMRPITSQNSTVDGRTHHALFAELAWKSPSIFVDPGLGEGPYLKVPRSADGEEFVHRVRPRVVVGDCFWVRERARVIDTGEDAIGDIVRLRYEADGAESGWVPWPERLSAPFLDKCVSNGVHREGARTWLKVTAVKPQRPIDVTDDEARREGTGLARIQHRREPSGGPLVDGFLNVFEKLYGPGSLERWCWSYEFERRAEPPQEGERRC